MCHSLLQLPALTSRGCITEIESGNPLLLHGSRRALKAACNPSSALLLAHGWYLPPATQAEQKMRNLSVKTEQSKTTALSLQPSDNMWVEGPGSLDYSEDGLAPGSQLWPSLKGFQFCVRHREAS